MVCLRHISVDTLHKGDTDDDDDDDDDNNNNNPLAQTTYISRCNDFSFSFRHWGSPTHWS